MKSRELKTEGQAPYEMGPLCSEHGKAELGLRANLCGTVYAHNPVEYERCLKEACTLVSGFEDWKLRPGF